MENDFYLRLEERFRGSAELIKQRLSAYLPITEQIHAQHPGAPAIDVGCGRGEWLELMARQGFTVRGIDTNADMISLCTHKGIEAHCEDALDYLSRVDDASVALVSGFHIAEHIPFDSLLALMQQAHRVLLPGGLLILETPNPENLDVGLWAFYMDPTHRHPIPAPLLNFMGEEAGFETSHSVKVNGPEKPTEDSPLARIVWAFNAHPDSSLVAQKAGAEQPLELGKLLCDDLSPPVQQISRELEQLAARQKDEQLREEILAETRAELDRQVEENAVLCREAASHEETLRQQAASLAGALKNAEHEAETTREHYLNVRHQLREVQAQHHDLEQRAAHIYHQLMAMRQSASWRLTAPLRRLKGLTRSAPARLRRVMRGAFRLAFRIPVVRHQGQRLLRRVPALWRLKERVLASPQQGGGEGDSRVRRGSRREKIATDLERRVGSRQGGKQQKDTQ